MHISAPFIRRPIGTALLTIALMLAGIVAYTLLPVAPMPEVEFPTIGVNAGCPILAAFCAARVGYDNPSPRLGTPGESL